MGSDRGHRPGLAPRAKPSPPGGQRAQRGGPRRGVAAPFGAAHLTLQRQSRRGFFGGACAFRAPLVCCVRTLSFSCPSARLLRASRTAIPGSYRGFHWRAIGLALLEWPAAASCLWVAVTFVAVAELLSNPRQCLLLYYSTLIAHLNICILASAACCYASGTFLPGPRV